jgi:hypothetical protein
MNKREMLCRASAESSFRTLMNMHDGRFLPLNRDYKPLGPEVRIKRLTAARAEKIGLIDGNNFYYLYDDATNPQSSPANWRRYEEILARVMKFEVDEADGGKPPRRVRRRYDERIGFG